MFRRGSSGAVSSMLLYTGSVSKWPKGKAFGFLKDADDGSTFFCHIDDVELDRAISRGPDRVAHLPEGLEVDFDTAVVEGRTKAVNVTLFGGGRVTAQSIAAITGDSPRRGGDDRRRDDRRDFDRRDDRRDFDRRDDRRDYDRRDDRRDFDRRDDRHGDDRMWQG
jgi:cold shock CspA family protein